MFQSTFIPALPNAWLVLLILDGHKSYLTFQLRVVAIDNSVHLLKLPPHTTHVLQPLDVGGFALMKVTWRKIVADFTGQHPAESRHPCILL